MTDDHTPRPSGSNGRFSPHRLRMARELASMSQADLAEDLVTAAAISQYETGGATPSSRMVGQLAARLGVGREFLLVTDTDVETPAYFRSLRSAPAAELKRARHMVQLVRQVARTLEADVKLPSVDLPRYPVTEDAEDDRPEKAANRVRREWDLDPGPIPDVVRLLERHGVIVARLATGHEKIDAFSVAFGDRPVAMMSAAKGKKDRSRFDLAHELGHLVMHDPGQRSTKVAERQAQRFAAALLMPASEIRADLPRDVDLDRFVALKRRWQVSIAALLYRAKTLPDVMNEATYTAAMKMMSARGWRRHEPVDLGPAESPTMLRRGMEVAGVDEVELAKRTAMPMHLLRDILDLATADDRPRIEL